LTSSSLTADAAFDFLNAIAVFSEKRMMA